MVDLKTQLTQGRGWRVGIDSENLSNTERIAQVKRQSPRRLVEAQKLEQSSADFANNGEWESAVRLVKKALEIRLNLLGPDDNDFQNRSANLARMLTFLADRQLQQGKFADARATRSEVLAIWKKLFNQEYWLVKQAQIELADVDVIEKLGDVQRRQYFDALAVLRSETNATVDDCSQMVKTLTDVFGRRHPRTAEATYQLAMALWANKELPRTIELLRLALEDLNATTGQGSQWFFDCQSQLITALQMMAVEFDYEGQLSSAERLLDESLRLQIELQGGFHPTTANIGIYRE